MTTDPLDPLDQLDLLDPLDALVGDWMTLQETAEALGADLRRVRRLLQERELLSVRRPGGADGAVRQLVPALLVSDRQPVLALAGTLTLLADAGYTDEEALTWLFTADDSLPGSPIEALRAGRKTEIRRRAQALAF